MLCPFAYQEQKQAFAQEGQTGLVCCLTGQPETRAAQLQPPAIPYSISRSWIAPCESDSFYLKENISERLAKKNTFNLLVR